MGKVMLTLKCAPEDRDLAKLRQQLNLSPEEVDAGFGVVVIDPKKNLCTILIEESAASRISGQPGVKGPFANPTIEPFGPPQK
jgi:hypothetical protein